MIDRTNVGISPLLSTPVTTQLVGTPGVETAFTTDAFSLPTTFATDAFAQPTTFTTDAISQPTTFTTDALTQPVTYTTDAFSLPTTFTAGSVPLVGQAFPTTPVLDQGLALQQPVTMLPETTTVLPDVGLVAPPTDQALTQFVPDVTGAASLVPTPEAQALTLATPGLQSVVTPPTASLVIPGSTLPVGVEGATLPPVTTPEFVSTNPLAQTTGAYSTASASAGLVPPPIPQNQHVGPIMDEDFQRGRPIYDEFREDRYRGFRLGQ